MYYEVHYGCFLGILVSLGNWLSGFHLWLTFVARMWGSHFWFAAVAHISGSHLGLTSVSHISVSHLWLASLARICFVPVGKSHLALISGGFDVRHYVCRPFVGIVWIWWPFQRQWVFLATNWSKGKGGLLLIIFCSLCIANLYDFPIGFEENCTQVIGIYLPTACAIRWFLYKLWICIFV